MSVSYEDLQPLREYIARLEAKVEVLYKHLGMPYESITEADDDPRIIEKIRQNDLLGAMRVYRELHPTSAGNARMAVEEMKARLKI